MNFTGERYMTEVSGMIKLQHYHRYEFVIQQLELNQKTVLDIACGEGYGTNILSRHSKKAIGVDISEEAINFAINKYQNKNLEFITGDVTKIPLNDNSVDIVVSFETIEHHDMHVEMLKEIKRVLKIDGILIISSPDKGYYETYFPGGQNEFHVKELYKDEFQKLLQRFFSNNTMFMQNNNFGSIIACEKVNELNYKPPISSNTTNSKNVILESRFNISVSSDKIINTTNPVSLYSNDINYDPFMRLDSLERTLDNMYSSITWKIGRLILCPFKIFKRFFNK